MPVDESIDSLLQIAGQALDLNEWDGYSSKICVYVDIHVCTGESLTYR